MEKKMTDKNQIIKEIRAGETSLGIEFGSTRIKAVLVGKEHAPIASGSYEWENQLVDSIWTAWKISGKDCRPVIRNWQKM